MGANAQTTVPTFVASQVLTADQQNQSARTGVPVFASTVTRDAAFGGTGEKTLAEGQLCYVEGTGFQTYNGTAWVTWGTAPSTGGLVYLTGASFTTATSVSLPNSTFTATYRNYRMILVLTALTADADFTGRLRASGSDNSTTNYMQMANGANSSGTATPAGAGGQTAFNMGESDPTIRYSLSMDIIAPQVAENSYIHGTYTFVDKAVTGNFFRSFGQIFATTTQFDSFTFISSVASSITGSYQVFGYTNS